MERTTVQESGDIRNGMKLIHFNMNDVQLGYLMVKKKQRIGIYALLADVAPKGIEPLPKVPETSVLSIKLRSPFLRMAKVIFKL